MAELKEHSFQEVMQHWKRMCDTYTTEDAATCCKGCGLEHIGCPAIYESDSTSFDVIEREVMAWAEENPAPIYPSWVEWFQQAGIAPPEQKCFHSWLFEHIPADVAQKLGIKPKEGV